MRGSLLKLVAGRGRQHHGIPTIFIRRHAFMAMILSFFFSIGASAYSTAPSANLTFGSLEPCSNSSYTMSKYTKDDSLEPCILYDIRDFSARDLVFELIASNLVGIANDNGISNDTTTSEITMVQVTPSRCHNHRDGAATAVKLLNANNNGRGTSIGFYGGHYVKFRLVSIVAGNLDNIPDDAYKKAHSSLLDSVLEEISNAHYILGSCSGQSSVDKNIALKREKVVISQVGPPGFYKDVKTNPYVFGIHVNSNTYPLPAFQALEFHLKAIGKARSLQAIRVLYRNKSEFFYSTCRSVIDKAKMHEFDVTEIEYDPFASEDGSDIQNFQNAPFLQGLTDQLCPPSTTNDNSIDGDDGTIDDQLRPALFVCVLNGEADVIIDRLRANGCRPSLSWFTTATWGWSSDNPDVVPYFQGGGQWHKNFKYSDNFFESGQDVLNYGLEEYGYSGNYDHVVSYAIPNLIADLLRSFFRIDDVPDAADAFSNRYEDLRRALSYINAHTIFGLVSFNDFQRNIGRGGAGMQWIPASYADTNNVTENDESEFAMGCMSPSDQADAAIIIPSPSGSMCPPGKYVNKELIKTEPSLLGNKCSACPIDSYTSEENEYLQCIVCPAESSTMGDIGATKCFQENPNLIPVGAKSMGYLFVTISWSFAIGYIVWMIWHRDDSVIKIGQPEFLFFICVGAIISSSAIIPLTLAEANVDEDTTRASRNCQAFPFLYFLGWVLMYSSLAAKSYRLTKIAAAASHCERIQVTAKEMYKIIIAFLMLDATILISWQIVDPLTYIRTTLTRSVDEDTDVITIETVGRCASNSFWKFVGPIIGIHVCLMIITNALLWRVKSLSDRYQEQKFVALASIYNCELLLLGVPILFSVQDSAAARYIVIAGVIFLTDTGVTSFIFMPKIKYQHEGLPLGMSVVESMNIRSSVRRKSVYQQDNPELSHSNYFDASSQDKSRRDTSRHGAVSINSTETKDRKEDLSITFTKQTPATVTFLESTDGEVGESRVVR